MDDIAFLLMWSRPRYSDTIRVLCGGSHGDLFRFRKNYGLALTVWCRRCRG